MLFKLSLKNIKKSIKDYGVYFFTLVIAVAIFYIFNSIDTQKSMLKLTKSKEEMVESLVLIINFMSVFVSIILGFLIIYSNNFIIKKRKKEIGLYELLGMSKRKVSTMLVLETIFVGIISLIIGLLIGVFLSQIITMFIAKLFEADMTNFKFIFSFESMIKTILYFSIIFILVMVFNVVMLSKYKLITLLNANRKNEKIKLKNKYIILIVFILSIVFLGYAYYLLFNGAMFKIPGKDLSRMLIFGSIGTFLFFWSLSGFLLKIFQKIKKIYLNKLNIFILKQVNNKINTSVISTTIICLMLLLTIGILSGSMSLASVFNTDVKENNLTDFTIQIFDNKMGNDFYKTLEIKNFNDYVSDYVVFNEYVSNDILLEDLMTSKSINEAKKEYGDSILFDFQMPIISNTDYNNIMKIFNKKTIDLEDDEYIVLANIDQAVKYLNPALEDNNEIIINSKKLYPKINKVVNTALMNNNANGNDGVLVVSDYLVEDLKYWNSVVIGNYIKNDNIDKIEENFYNAIGSSKINNYNIRTKLEMEASSIGIKAILIFLGLYLGIVFAISSATVLAIGQLSQASDNKQRYNILRQIGTDEKMINKALFIQILITFLLPLVVALIHAIFGLKEINDLLKLIANINLSSNIVITTIFILVVYGGYFLVTYIYSKRIIEEK